MLSDYEHKSLQKLGEAIHAGNWSTEALVKLFKLSGEYLNIETIPNYAKTIGMSYPGVIKTRKVTELFDVKFIIDND
jgi:hypothetical protein